MGLTINDPFVAVIGFSELKYCYNGIEWVIILDPNKMVAIGSVGCVELGVRSGACNTVTHSLHDAG